MNWQEVGDRVFTRRFKFFNQQIGVVLGGRDVLVVDTRSTPAQAREILADLRELTRDPVTLVVDTHWHFDHAFGNSVFRPATIWGHARTVDRLLTRGQATIEEVAAELPAIASDIREVVIDPPDRTFDDRATVEVGDRVVELAYLGRAHTDTDIVITVPDARRAVRRRPARGRGAAELRRLLPDGVAGRGRADPAAGRGRGRPRARQGRRPFLRRGSARGLPRHRRARAAGPRGRAVDLEAALAEAPFGAAARDAFDRALPQLRGELLD